MYCIWSHINFVIWYVCYFRYYGLKPLLDEAYIRIKELEMENDFLKWSKIVPDNTKTTIDQTSIDHIKKTFCDVLTQTQSVLQLDKVYKIIIK